MFWELLSCTSQVSDIALSLIRESADTEFTYDLKSFRSYLSTENDQPILVRLFCFNFEDQLVMKAKCSLLTTEVSHPSSLLPVYKISDCNLSIAEVSKSPDEEFIQAQDIMRRFPNKGSPGVGSVMRQQYCELNSETSRLSAVNSHHHLDRVLLQLRSNINKRISEIERNWLSKKAKTDDDEAVHKKDMSKFRQHLHQSLLKDFPATNELLSKEQTNHSVPYTLLSLQVKVSKPATSVGAKKKTPATKPKKATDDRPVEAKQT